MRREFRAARFCADVDHRIANAFALAKDFLFLSDAKRKRVDQRILR